MAETIPTTPQSSARHKPGLPPYCPIEPIAIDKLRSLKPNAKHVLRKIAALDKGDTPSKGGHFACFATNESLAEMCGMSLTTFRRHLGVLVRGGWVVEKVGKYSLRYRRAVMVGKAEKSKGTPVQAGPEAVADGVGASHVASEAPAPAGRRRFKRRKPGKTSARSGRRDYVAEVMALPIDSLWELYPKELITPRNARSFMRYWNQKVITRENLPGVVDHAIVAMGGQYTQGDLPAPNSLEHFMATYAIRRDQVNKHSKEALFSRARAMGDVFLSEEILSTPPDQLANYDFKQRLRDMTATPKQAAGAQTIGITPPPTPPPSAPPQPQSPPAPAAS